MSPLFLQLVKVGKMSWSMSSMSKKPSWIEVAGMSSASSRFLIRQSEGSCICFEEHTVIFMRNDSEGHAVRSLSAACSSTSFVKTFLETMTASTSKLFTMRSGPENFMTFEVQLGLPSLGW